MVFRSSEDFRTSNRGTFSFFIYLGEWLQNDLESIPGTLDATWKNLPLMGCQSIQKHLELIYMYSAWATQIGSMYIQII